MIYETQCCNCGQLFESDNDLEYLFDEENQEYYRGCPNCKTDEYLMSFDDDVFFTCSLQESPCTLNWCENNCPRYYSCDTVARVNDELKNADY